MVYDYIVIAGYFLLVVGIGIVFSRLAKNSTSDYFRGGGRMLWWMVGSAAFMAQISAFTFTGGAGKAFNDGFAISLVFFGDPGNQGLRADALLLRTQHDRCAMCIVGTDIGAIMPAQFLEAGPDIGLYVLHQVSDMDRPVGIGQGTGNQNCTLSLTHSNYGDNILKDL